MGRQDGQRSRDRLQQQHEDACPAQIGAGHRAGDPLVPIAERRLIAVVAVGQRDRARADPRADVRDLGLVGLDPPQPMRDRVAVHDLGHRCLGQAREPIRDPARGIDIQPDNRARVHTGGPEELVAILLRLGQRPLMRSDARVEPERLEPDAGEDASANSLDIGARNAIHLFVRVEARPRISVQRAVGAR